MYHCTGKLSGGTKKPEPSKGHAGARRAMDDFKSKHNSNDPGEDDDEFPYPPPPPLPPQKNNHPSNNSGLDINTLLSGLLGGGGGDGQSGASNLGSIFSMLGGNR